MPELPEVEIVRQSLHKKIKKKSIKKVINRKRNLRIKIPSDFAYSIPSTIDVAWPRASISSSFPKRISTFDFINSLKDFL